MKRKSRTISAVRFKDEQFKVIQTVTCHIDEVTGKAKWIMVGSRVFKCVDERPPNIVHCRQCHNIFDKRTAFKIWSYDKHNLYICTEGCYLEWIDKWHEAILDKREEYDALLTCSIIKMHDQDMKNDPERIDIKKFMNRYIECGEDEHGGEEVGKIGEKEAGKNRKEGGVHAAPGEHGQEAAQGPSQGGAQADQAGEEGHRGSVEQSKEARKRAGVGD